jgi:flagellar basal-body rod modification protein FlgD
MAINGTLPTTGTGTGTGATGSTGAAGTAASSATSLTGGVNIGGTDFLTLMLAQLKNQDPTSPLDSNQFLTQLAQLSQVQGISQLNTSFSTLASSLTSSQALQASSLLGAQVLVASSTASIQANGTVSGAVQVPQNTSDVVVSVADSSGALVQQIDLGAQSTGLANFSWDGTVSGGTQAPAGTYTFTAQVAGAASGTAATTYINGLVQSVSMGGTAASPTSTNGTTAGSGGLTLNVSGQGSVPFSSVLQISP